MIELQLLIVTAGTNTQGGQNSDQKQQLHVLLQLWC